MKVNSSKPLTFAEVKDTLEAREKEGELGYEQKVSLEYVSKLSKHESKKSESMVEKLMENKKVTRDVAATLVNISPKHPETVKAIAQKDKVDLTEDEAQEIAKMLRG